MSAVAYESIETIFSERTTTIARDLKLNLKKLLESGALTPEEASLVLIATASTLNCAPLISLARGQLEGLGVDAECVQEAVEGAALVGMLNIYYRFRHMADPHEDYANAGLRMTALAKPVNGKERFEMLAFAVSVLNGCEACIKAHEKALRTAGIEGAKIHDLARLAAVAKGVSALALLIEQLFQDFIAPQLDAIRSDIRGVDARMGALETIMESQRRELLAEIHRAESTLSADFVRLEGKVDVQLAAMNEKLVFLHNELLAEIKASRV